MRLFILLLAVAIISTGCATSQQELARTKAQATVAAYNMMAQQQATDKGDNHIAEFLSQNTESGAVGWTRTRRPAFGPDGTPLIENGKYVYIEQESVGKSNSMRDVPTGVAEVYFKLAGIAVNPKTGEMHIPSSEAEAVNSAGLLEAVFFWAKGTDAGTGSTMSSEFAAVWAGASVAEKQAAADAVARYLEGRKELATTIITEGGKVATGVLKEIGKATPYGAASALVEAVIVDDSGQEVKGTITEPFRTPPPNP